MTRTLWTSALCAVALAAPSAALAGKCDSLVAAASSAKGDALVSTYKRLGACDGDAARTEYERFMVKAGDLETLVPLTLSAISLEAHTSIWKGMDRVPYEFRGQLAQQVGEACSTQPEVVTFVQAAYVALKGAEFATWVPAMKACEAPAMTTWLEEVLVDPPTSTYNEKYNAVLQAYVDTRRMDALPTLEKAATVIAGRGGPLSLVLDAMQRATQPESFRDQPDPADVTTVEEALVRIAQAAPPEVARQVADRIYALGSEPLAASLLPSIYADRVQSGGGLMWVAAAIEQCDGDAVVHWVSWTEAPTRLAVLEPATAPLRAAKPKLKCAGDPWVVRASETPVAGRAGAEAFVQAIVDELDGQGVKAKDREETKVTVSGT
ncbi:MAG: hypothetical protein H6733_04750 [Alphaproteobacteria bacterium]|nr:hypothetical protein [Alphaproteobacteria bacterium]